MAVGLAPVLANAASSQTYFIGFPEWLPVGGATLPSNPLAINNAIVGAKDTHPLIAWGLGEVDLKPVWVTWIDGVPSYTLPEVGQTGSHTESNPAYQVAYDAAYSAAYNTYCRLNGNRAACATNAALSAVASIPLTITVPDYGVVKDGYWTTQTAGQWVSPSDLGALPTAGQLAYLAYALQHGDTGALAPILNWTAYLTNVNLIAYGDGAIAAGAAYQAFLDSARGATHEGYDPYAVGVPQTGPRQIAIVGPDGHVTLVTVNTQNLPTPLPTPQYPDGGSPPDYEVTQPGGVVDVTVLSLVLVRNPGRANGGLYARFAPVYQAVTGINPITPERQDILPEGVDPDLIRNLLTGNGGGLTLDELGNLQAVIENADGKPIVITLKADIGWQYDLLSDAPATANPIAWANSVASAVFLTNLITGTDFQNLGGGGYIGPDGTVYYTLPVDQLPLLTPLRLPAQLVGLATGNTDVNTPLADALEPALRMMVNLGYTDVVRNPDGTYTRTLDKFGEPTLFGTRTLTREQAALVPGDLIAALGAGFGDELSDVLIRTKNDVVKTLEIKLTDQQDVEIDKALSHPGSTIRTVSRDVGNGVSQVLTAVESGLPELPEAAKADPEKAHRAVQAVKSAIGNDRSNAAAVAEKQTSAADSTSSVKRKTPVRDAVKKVGDDIKKTVDKVAKVNKAKKAEKADAKGAAD
ncbi:PE-PPE domain-containing protein [Mycolicibacterium frederiksbergense]|uniref:PE-PPE domain-containing protein n=1 Tax=Mycolicibacterium frederiksbergense TaxID=117567 RepID=UPI0024772A1F|nr:PE-PPE domain-containing protein [Mycolicibacterium frederiksbergense]